MGRLKDALQCAMTYLLFHEGEEFVTDNVDYYREVLGHDGKPREVRICCHCRVGRGRWFGSESKYLDVESHREDGWIIVSAYKKSVRE